MLKRVRVKMFTESMLLLLLLLSLFVASNATPRNATQRNVMVVSERISRVPLHTLHQELLCDFHQTFPERFLCGSSNLVFWRRVWKFYVIPQRDICVAAKDVTRRLIVASLPSFYHFHHTHL